MNIEKSMQFILEHQARFEANLAKMEEKHERDFARSNRRLDRIEQSLSETQRVLKQTNRVVGKLASAGVGLRSDIRRHEKWLAKHEEATARHELRMEEMEDKLNVIIDILDKSIRRDGDAGSGKREK